MRIQLLSLAAVLLIAGLGGAEAKTLVSAPTYGGRSQSSSGFATCRVFNGGTGFVSVTRRQIMTSSGTLLGLASDTCAAGIGPGGYCAFVGSGAGNVAFSCSLDLSGSSAALVRAVMEVSNGSADVLNALPAQ